MKHEVVSLIGKLKYDCVGGGRPSSILVDVGMDYIENYNKKCKEKGIEFNYLLNPLCLAGKDVNSKEHIKIICFIKDLKKRGITAVAVNSPYSCEVIKEQFPGIKVTVGIYANVDSLMKVKRWIDLGADEIILVHNINRNFELLKSILMYLKGTNVSVRLIANNFCLYQCPFEMNHDSTVAHASENSQIASCYIDYNIVNCYYRKIKYIGNLMSSDWIRPEDVEVYEKLCEETGNGNLVLKLVERTKTTDFLENVIKAYLNREYNGNLSDLMNWSNKLKSPIDPKEFL